MNTGILILGKNSFLELENKCVITYLIHWLQSKIFIGEITIPALIETSLICSLSKKMNIREDVFSLHRKKRHLTWLCSTLDLRMQMNSHEQIHPSTAHLVQPTPAWLQIALLHFPAAQQACKPHCAGHTNFLPYSTHTWFSFTAIQ